MNAKSIKGGSLEEIDKELKKAMADGFQPTLAMVFLSLQMDRQAICDKLSRLNITIFGVTTNGEFINEVTEKGSVAMMLLDLDRSFFRLYFKEYPARNYREVSAGIASRALEDFARPAFLIGGSDIETDAEELLFGFSDAVGAQVSVFGVMAGDDYQFIGGQVFTNERYSTKGVICIVLDEEKIIIKGIATCGWRAVGTEKTVTKSEGNHVFTVDDIPVLDITAKYGGIENVSPGNTELYMELGTNFPLQLQRETGDPVMRPGLRIDWSDRSFYCSGSIAQGSKVRFSLPPDFDVMEKVVKNAQNLKDTEMPEADALIVFSCGGRILSLGPLMNLELEGIKKIWNVPMAGMFSTAELARATGGNLEMHNLTTCCVALKER